MSSLFSFFFFFNDTATTEIYTLSLHDALPICQRPPHPDRRRPRRRRQPRPRRPRQCDDRQWHDPQYRDRKSTRLNSSHSQISYAVFCLKKKKNTKCIYTHYSHIHTRMTSTSTQ